MWIHLLALGLIDGAGSEVIPDPTPAAAGWYDDVKTKPKKKFFIEQDGKLLVFNTAQQAVNAKKVEKPQAEVVEVVEAKQEPEQVISLPVVQEYAQVSGLIEQYNTAYNSQHYEALIALFERMQDEQEEDDIEALLLAL